MEVYKIHFINNHETNQHSKVYINKNFPTNQSHPIINITGIIMPHFTIAW